MPFSNLPELLGPALTGIGGLVAGHLTSRRGRIAKLEKEVEACKARDARVVVIEAGFRLVVGALMRTDPECPELRLCGQLLNKRLPLKAEDREISSFEDLLAQIDREEDAEDA